MLTAASLRTTESHLAKLARAGIATPLQLLEYFPRALNDMSRVLTHFAFVNLKEKNSVVATLDFFGTERTKFGKQILKAVLRDDGGNLCEAVWFGRQFWAKDYKAGDRVLIYGKPNYKFGRLSFPSPDVSRWSPDAALLAPVYSELEGISSDWFVGKIALVRKHLDDVYDLLPSEIRRKNGFRTRRENIEAAHFPSSVADWERARRELAYEELFGYQHAGLLRKEDGDRASKGRSFCAPMRVEDLKAVLAGLPFPLTDHQKVALFSILKDMEKDVAMNRLLQGDVGTGKTVVAWLACWHAVKFAGAQCAVMVPTSVLANQHYANAQKFFGPLGLRPALLTGDMSKKEQDAVKAAVAAGDVDVLIGTHALIVADVHFRALGLAVIDEQHRFGVDQRKILENKNSAREVVEDAIAAGPSRADNAAGAPSGSRSSPHTSRAWGSVQDPLGPAALVGPGSIGFSRSEHPQAASLPVLEDGASGGEGGLSERTSAGLPPIGTREGRGQRAEKAPLPRIPHVLYMTATPIPRTLTLTIYGDQDVSVIRQYPAGRKPIVTKVFPSTGRLEAYRFVESQVESGAQIYWVSPLVEESDQLDYADVLRTTAMLREAFPGVPVGMVHGRMKPIDKQAAMDDFKSGKTKILSATSVIEVGVDNPNATVICVEGAEKFGLSQLHQLRGRVGRGERQSYCFLFPSKPSPNARLEAMESTADGFELSEIDLELRGPGEVWGVRQSGVPDFRIADLRDVDLISRIRDDIKEWMAQPG